MSDSANFLLAKCLEFTRSLLEKNDKFSFQVHTDYRVRIRLQLHEPGLWKPRIQDKKEEVTEPDQEKLDQNGKVY